MSEYQFVPTEPSVDAWQKLQEMTKRAEVAEAKLAAVQDYADYCHVRYLDGQKPLPFNFWWAAKQAQQNSTCP